MSFNKETKPNKMKALKKQLHKECEYERTKNAIP